MNEIKNATIICKANVYYDGMVSSRTVILPSGDRVTLGFMQQGEYTFETREKEIMEVFSGAMRVKLPGSGTWRLVGPGERFEVPAKSEFSVTVDAFADYRCSYIT